MEDNTCYVCYERDMTQTLACSHKLCCHCYELLNKCPMCRMPYCPSDEIYYEFDDSDDDDDDDDESPFFGFLADFVALLLIAIWLKFSIILYINVFSSNSLLLL